MPKQFGVFEEGNLEPVETFELYTQGVIEFLAGRAALSNQLQRVGCIPACEPGDFVQPEYPQSGVDYEKYLRKETIGIGIRLILDGVSSEKDIEAVYFALYPIIAD